MYCSKCKTIITPISGINFGTRTQPLCKKCIDTKNKKIKEAAQPNAFPGCMNHRTIQAQFICRICGAPICETCVFKFPENTHLCPNCINKPLPLSPKQRMKLNLSYLAAGVATATLIILILALIFEPDFLNNEDLDNSIGILYILFNVLPSTMGIVMAQSARSRNQKNHLSTLIALIWNKTLYILFILIMLLNIIEP